MSETEQNAEPGGWEAELGRAFAVLLAGREAERAAAAGARYGVYHASETLDEFLFPNDWTTPDALSDPAPRLLPDTDGPYPFSPWTWRFDLAGSLFRFDPDLVDRTGAWGPDGHKGDSPFGAGFTAELRILATADEDGGLLLSGADLGPLLARHGVDLGGDAAGKLNTWLTVLLRVATDGTLHDAMRAATFTERGPDHLVSPGDLRHARTAADPWEERLAALPHPGLRDHLRMLSLDRKDARSEGGHYSGSAPWLWSDLLDTAGCTLVAGWSFGESQAGTAVVWLPAA
ncbi:hypothetical protein ACIQBJ_02180 [Kitasatospora sp. NPDC088391]|uniref:hypothetical protein n=1 Tax=Kitasatospora sp. NPDC088391 TaxID=3364074 RepID=UPI0037FC66F3